MTKKTKNDIDPTASFEFLMESLEQTVTELEGEHISLDESIALHQRAVNLIAACRQRLQHAEQKIQKLTRDEVGKLHPEDMDAS